LRGGQIIAKILKVEGTDFISHYPNVGNVIGDAADEGIRIITTRHERTAVAIADAYTRYSMGHKHGVAMSQSGHAAHNLMGGMGQAFDDLSPILMMPAGSRMNQLEKRGGTQLLTIRVSPNGAHVLIMPLTSPVS